MEANSTWSLPEKLHPKQVKCIDVTGDGNCLFYCLLQANNDVEQVMNLRRKLMDYLTKHRNDLIPPDYEYTWDWLTMNSIDDNNKRAKLGRDAQWIPVSSFEEYTEVMLNSTPNARTTQWGDNIEIMLYAASCEKNVAVYQTHDGSYKMFDHYPLGRPSQFSEDWQLLYRTGQHYMMLTIVDTTNQTDIPDWSGGYQKIGGLDWCRGGVEGWGHARGAGGREIAGGGGGKNGGGGGGGGGGGEGGVQHGVMQPRVREGVQHGVLQSGVSRMQQQSKGHRCHENFCLSPQGF
jgi:hypothetical protein